ncbi:MAG: sugar ABC transporter permease, partial [Candidatus Dormiibacterota bacterium]
MTAGFRWGPLPRWMAGLALCVPAFLVVFGLLLYPLVYDLWVSLTDAANFHGSGRFVGLANYAALLSDPAYWRAALNTVALTLATAAVEMVVGLLTALLLWWRFWGRSIVFLAVFVPWAVPSALAAFSWFWLFLPPFHSFYTLQAIAAEQWLNGIFGIGAWDVLSLAVMNVWRGSSIIAIFLLAGLNAIPEELLEYGRLEARTRWHYLWHVVLPLNRRITVLAAAIALTITYFDFVSMYPETGGRVTVPMIGTLSYLDLILGGRTGYSAALILTQIPFAFALAALTLHFAERESRPQVPAAVDAWGPAGEGVAPPVRARPSPSRRPRPRPRS